MTQETFAVALPDAQAIAKHGTTALALVQAFEVVDDSTYELAGEELQAIQKRQTTLTEQRLSITRPIDEAKARIMALFRGPCDTLGQAADMLKGKMVAYARALQLKAAEERAQAERAAQAERDRLAAEAAALIAEGKAGEAEVKTQVAAMIVAAPAVQALPPKVAGVSTRELVTFEVVDMLALVKHVAAHPELIGMLKTDDVVVRAHVKSLGLKCATPGLRVFEKSSIAASRK